MKNETHMFVVRSKTSPVITVDSEVNAVYVYFKRCKVSRTVQIPSKTMILNVDLDGNGDVIGIEAVGGGQLEIRKLLEKAHVEAPSVDWSHARFGSPCTAVAA